MKAVDADSRGFLGMGRQGGTVGRRDCGLGFGMQVQARARSATANQLRNDLRNSRSRDYSIPHMPPMQAGPPQRCSAGVAHASGIESALCAEKVEYTLSIEGLPQSQLVGSGFEPMTRISKRDSHSPHWYSKIGITLS